MGMTEIKTKATKVRVEDFLNLIEPASKRDDAYTVLHLMEKITGEKAVMWGPSIVGFGKYHYKYDSGHEGDMCISAFALRKAKLVVYLVPGFDDSSSDLLEKLGKHKTSKGCLYINKLADVDLSILEALIQRSFDEVKKTYT